MSEIIKYKQLTWNLNGFYRKKTYRNNKKKKSWSLRFIYIKRKKAKYEKHIYVKYGQK